MSVDVFVSNYTVIDFELYDQWLTGASVNEVAVTMQQRGVLLDTGATFEELLSDVKDNFRLFSSLQQLLKCPTRFGEQTIYQIDIDTQRSLIDKYYQFDPTVARELLGRKLSNKNRNSLDEIAEKTKISLKSCCRQFDNIKRVFKTVEELPGSLEKNIKSHYILSDELCKKYASIVFMANHRFETGKRRLGHMTFEDFMFCSVHMIANWSYSAVECDDHEDMDVDLDRTFLQDLRDLKLLTEREHVDEQKNYVLTVLKPTFTRKKFLDLDENFKIISKAMINIAMGLNHSREVKNFFLDVAEKVVEPALLNVWTHDDMKLFLQTYIESGHRLSILRSLPSLATIWDRYMNTFMHCTLRIFPYSR